MTDSGNDRMRLCVWVHVSICGRLFSARLLGAGFCCQSSYMFVSSSTLVDLEQLCTR